MDGKYLDFSLGNPLLPLKAVAKYAFREASKDLNEYQTMTHAAYTPIGRILGDICDYFTSRGLHDPGWTGLGTGCLLMTGGGTTEGFELIMRAMSLDIKDWQHDQKETIKPVIVMPVPTYGYFCDNAKNWNIEVVALDRDMDQNGRVDPQKLEMLFKSLTEQGKRVVAYYDSNPNNPLGTVRTREETAALARVISAQSDIYQQYRFRHEGAWEGRIKIIDDMIYDGLQYDDQPEPCAFAQLGDKKFDHDGEFRHLFEDTYTLCGPSKAGLVNLRAGLVIAGNNQIDALQRVQMTTSYSPPKAAMHALQVWFSDKEPFAGWRRRHLKKMNALHRNNGLLMKALINGIDTMPEVDAKDRKMLEKTLADAAGISLAKAKQRLTRKIDGIKVVTTPQAGFFHLLDFSALKGRSYDRERLFSHLRSEQIKIKDEHNIESLIRSQNLHFAYGSWLRLDTARLLERVTFAKSPAEIVEFVQRLETIIGLLSPPPKAAFKQHHAQVVPA